MALDLGKYGTPLTPQSPTKKSGFDVAEYGLPMATFASARVTPKPKSIFRKTAEFVAPTLTKTLTKDFAAGEHVTPGELAGSALEAASLILPVGAVARGAVGAARAAGFIAPAVRKAAPSLFRQAARFAGEGAVSGALGGAGRAVGEGESATDVAKSTLAGAAGGAVVGAAIPPIASVAGKAISGVRNVFARKAARRAEEAALLRGVDAATPPPGPPGAPPGAAQAVPPERTSAIPDARIATKTLEEGTGRVRTEPLAKEAVRQGIPEADVALIRSGSSQDKSKMLRMLDVRQKQLTQRIPERATDVVGDTVIEKMIKPIDQLKRDAGKEVHAAAASIAGRRADLLPAIQSFMGDLREAGVTFGRKGKLKFKESDFEGISAVERFLSNVWNRAVRVAKKGDALQMHRLKSYIDSIVEYGVEGRGLRGKGERILKTFRHSIDEILDTQFSEYNAANTKFRDAIDQLQKIAVLLGKRFKIGDDFAGADTGIVMRRLLSNTRSRAGILNMLQGMRQVAGKYGIPIDEDAFIQANFADVLEKMLGSEAPTSFLGQGERFGNVVAAGADIAGGTPGGIVRGTIRAGKTLIDVTRGVTQEKRINALRALLRSEKGGFGRPPMRAPVPSAPTAPPSTDMPTFKSPASTTQKPRAFSRPKSTGATATPKPAKFVGRPPAEAFGAAGGIERDEETGEVKFNPEKALLGIAGVAAFTRGKETAFGKNAFQGLKNISTKLIEKFRGMPNEITRQQFNEVLNRARKEGLKKVDEDLIVGLVERQLQKGMSEAKQILGTETSGITKIKNIEIPEVNNGKEMYGWDDVWRISNKKTTEKMDKDINYLLQSKEHNLKPILLRRDGNTFQIEDGVHRVASYRGAGREDIPFVTKTAGTSVNNKINLTQLANEAQTQLVPLTPTQVKSPRYSDYAGTPQYTGDGRYSEIVYQSPIKTSAGDVHFGRSGGGRYPSPNNQFFPNYFSHVRYEDNGSTRKILETQSDLMQKENFESTLSEIKESIHSGMLRDLGSSEMNALGYRKVIEMVEQKAQEESRKLQPYNSNDPLAHLRTFREEVKRAAKDGKDTILIPSGDTAMKIEGLGGDSNNIWKNTMGQELLSERLKVGQQIFQGQDRMMNGIAPGSDSWIITDVLGDGKFKAVPKEIKDYKIVQFDNVGGKTFGIKGKGIRGTIGQKSYSTREKAERELYDMIEHRKETFDISGKIDTSHFVYKLNESAIPKEARRMGLVVEGKVIETKGGTHPYTEGMFQNRPGVWWKIKIPKERARMPVEAFGALAPLAFSGQERSKQKRSIFGKKSNDQ